MTHQRTLSRPFVTPRPPGARRVAAPAGLLAAAVLLLGGPALGQEASPASGATDDGAAQTPVPTLTMAPLVTLPPISAPPVSTPTDLADGYALGAADASVTVEVWEDFQCPYCQWFAFQVKPLIVDEFVRDGRVRYIFRDLPFLGEESRWASVAASLAADQGLFWPFHDYLFANLRGENRGSYSLDRLLQVAEAVGLDMEAFTAGLRIDAARARYAEIEARAREDADRLGIDSTPTVVINGTPLESPLWEDVSAALRAALAASQASPSTGGAGESVPPVDGSGANPAP